MAFEPEDGTLDRDVDRSMRMFERSQVGPAGLISPVRPSRILVALDGSDQDEVSIAACVHLRDVFDVETLVLDAREINLDADGSGSTLATEVAKRISGARPIVASQGEAYERILAALGEHQLDLVVLPSPFGRSFETVGTDSIGTVLDVMLARCGVPILISRRGDQTLPDCLRRIAMVVGGECDVELRAASWVFGLAAEDSEITLNLAVEKEHFENLRSIVEALTPGTSLSEQQVSDALRKSHQAIDASMRRTAGDLGLSYQATVQSGEAAPPNPLNDSLRQLLVMPLEIDDRFGQGFVQDRIRRSPHPVLVVPGHAPSG